MGCGRCAPPQHAPDAGGEHAHAVLEGVPTALQRQVAGVVHEHGQRHANHAHCEIKPHLGPVAQALLGTCSTVYLNATILHLGAPLIC
eukprot:COSAG05_NODE_214_length_13907_cov_28.992178_28_plen_88_part_00